MLQIFRIVLLLLMIGILLLMAQCPVALTHNREYKEAHVEFQRNPNEQTEQRVVEAKMKHGRTVARYQIAMFVVFCGLAVGFVYVGRHMPQADRDQGGHDTDSTGP